MAPATHRVPSSKGLPTSCMQLGLNPVPSIAEHPVSEALFNFVNAWSLMLWPAMLADPLGHKVKNKLPIWVGTQVRRQHGVWCAVCDSGISAALLGPQTSLTCARTAVGQQGQANRLDPLLHVCSSSPTSSFQSTLPSGWHQRPQAEPSSERSRQHSLHACPPTRPLSVLWQGWWAWSALAGRSSPGQRQATWRRDGTTLSRCCRPAEWTGHLGWMLLCMRYGRRGC